MQGKLFSHLQEDRNWPSQTFYHLFTHILLMDQIRFSTLNSTDVIQWNSTNANLTLKLTGIVFCVLPCLILPPQPLQSVFNFYHWNGKFYRKTVKMETEDKNLEGRISDNSALQFTFCIVAQWETTDNLGSVPGSGNELQPNNVQAASPLSSIPLVWKTGCFRKKKKK